MQLINSRMTSDGRYANGKIGPPKQGNEDLTGNPGGGQVNEGLTSAPAGTPGTPSGTPSEPSTTWRARAVVNGECAPEHGTSPAGASGAVSGDTRQHGTRAGEWPASSNKWLWLCQACPKLEGWSDIHQWVSLGYPGPIERIRYPTSGNLGHCGPEVCGMLPAPWCISGIAWESCGPECTVPTTPWGVSSSLKKGPSQIQTKQ